MAISSTQRRRAAVALVGLLAALCGALFSTSGASQAAAAPAPGAAAKPAAAVQPAAAGAAARAQSPHQATESPGATDGASAPRHAEPLPPASQLTEDHGDDDVRGCHKQQGGTDGTVPVTPSGPQQNLLSELPVCLTPESHHAIGAAHARPPVRGPAPIPPPSPAELSVLRV